MIVAGVALLVWRAAEVYAVLGAVTAAAFLTFGLAQVDASARGAYAFRPLLVPGLVLLWPLVLWRWRVLARGDARAPTGRRYAATHRAVWVGLAVLLPLALFAALALRQSGPLEAPSVQLAPAP